MGMRSLSAMAAASLVLAACGPASGPQGTDLQTRLVVEEGAQPALYADIVTSSIGHKRSEQPAPFETIEITSRCTVPRASSGAKIAYVYTYGGGRNAPVHHAFVGEDGETDMHMRIARMPGDDKMFSAGSAVAREMEALAKARLLRTTRQLDVMVTETERPVYLVLASYDSLLWNLQLAPGARIDGVAVIAYNGGVLANGPDPSRVGFLNFRGSPHSKCYPSPQGRAVPVADRIASAKELNPDINLGSYPDQWRAELAETNNWYRRVLPRLVGGKADIVLNWANGGSFEGVLVGPVPEIRFASQPITRLQVPSHLQAVWGSRKHAEQVLGLDQL